jgi:ribonuclease HII
VSHALGWRDRQLLRTAPEVVGIDEVGRGALAGPVVVCATVFDRIPHRPEIQDSKTVSRRRRECAAAWVRSAAKRWAAVEVWVEVIDRVNILEATRLAMRSLARTVAGPGSVVVVDGVELGLPDLRVLSPPRADSAYFAVAAASLVAKVHRDRLMAALAVEWPGWQWQQNVGYPSAAHRRAIADLGVNFLHRKSFRCESTTRSG